MRRPPEVGLVLLFLLGTSGCAGFSQRLNSSPPGAARTDEGEEAATASLSWWRPRPASPATSGSPSDPAGTSQPAPRTVAAGAPGDVWEESQSEWMARNFPRISQLWKQDTTNGPRAGNDLVARSQASRATARSGDATAAAARADGEVRPADSSSTDDPPPAAASPAYRPRLAGQPTRSSNASVVKARPHSLPESTGDVELDVSGSGSPPAASNSSDEPERSPAAAQQAQDDASSKPWADGPVPAVVSSADRAAAAPVAAPEVVPASDESSPAPKQAVAAAESAVLDSPAGPPASSTALALESAPQPATDADTRMAQAPARPPANTVPPAPPIVNQAKPADSPPTPPAATGAGTEPSPTVPPSSTPAAPAAPPTQASTPAATSAQASTPAATSAQASTPPSGSGQVPGAGSPAAAPMVSARAPVAASPQSIYASPPPVAAAPHKCKLLSWLHHDQTAEPLASPQLPPPTFPSSYRTFAPASHAVAVQAIGQGNKAPCATTTAPCATAQPTCAPAVKAPKKPCFLKVWIHNLKSGGHASACGDCQPAEPSTCCHGCACCGKKVMALPSPQVNVTATQGNAAAQANTTTTQGSTAATPGNVASPNDSASSSEAKLSSRGPEADDVAEGRKVVGAAASQVVDKPPQG